MQSSKIPESDIYFAVMAAQSSGCSLEDFIDYVKSEWKIQLIEQAERIK